MLHLTLLLRLLLFLKFDSSLILVTKSQESSPQKVFLDLKPRKSNLLFSEGAPLILSANLADSYDSF